MFILLRKPFGGLVKTVIIKIEKTYSTNFRASYEVSMTAEN
jgi:hypothetical protein